MFIFKIVILGLIVAITTYIGILISKKYVNRVKQLKDLKLKLLELKNKMKFTYEPLGNIFLELSKNGEEKVRNVFKEIYINMNKKSLKEVWNKAFDSEQLSFTKEDREIIKELGNLLGKTDLEGQVSKLEVTDLFIDMQIEKGENERRKSEKMYKSLGVIFGIALVIILV